VEKPRKKEGLVMQEAISSQGNMGQQKEAKDWGWLR